MEEYIFMAPLGDKKIQNVDNFWGSLRGPKNKKNPNLGLTIFCGS